MKNPTAAIVIIGDEILSGRTKDTNAGFIAARLHQRGVETRRILTIPDDLELIAATVNGYRREYDLVFACGGIGATPDDMTRDAMAKAFQVPCRRNGKAAEMLAEYYGERLNDLRLKMADLPEGCELIANEISGAPGFRLQNVYVFPGVPGLMRKMFETVEPSLPGGAVVTEEVASPIGETLFADLMEEAVLKFPAVKIGSYPEMDEQTGKWHCSLTFTSSTREDLDQAKNFLMEAINNRAGSN